MFAGQGNQNCTFEKFSMAGGRMDAVMTCNAGAQGKMKMTMGGPYGGDNYALDSEITMSGATGTAGKGEMKIKASNTGKRTGECKPA
jgi:hypothetical protein